MAENQALLNEINKLIGLLQTDDNDISDEAMSMIDELEVRAKEVHESKTKEASAAALSSLVSAFERIRIPAPEIPAPQVTVQPPEVTVTVPEIKVPDIHVQVPEIKAPAVHVPAPIINIPDTIEIRKPSWIDGLFTAQPIIALLQEIKQAVSKEPQAVGFPVSARSPVAVRLSDGEKFYNAMGGFTQAVQAMPRTFSVNHLDDTSQANILYVGRQDQNGNWMVTRIDETGSYPVFTYASIINNEGYDTYAAAWLAHTSLVYGLYASSL